MRSRTFSVVMLVIALVFLAGFPVGAEEETCPNANPSLKLKPMSADQQKVRIVMKLGSQPTFTENEWSKLKNGKVILKEKASKSDAKRMEAFIIIPRPSSEIMAALKDFKGQVGKMPHLIKVKPSWNGNLAHVDFWLKIAWKEIHYVLNVAHHGDSYIEWEYVCGDITETEGYWKFFPLEDGKKTLVIYHVYTDPGLPVPEFIARMLTSSSMPDVVMALKKMVVDKAGK